MFGKKRTGEREKRRNVRYRIYRVSQWHEARGWLGTVDEETLSAYSCPEEYLSLNFGGGDYRLYEVIDGRLTNRVHRYVIAGFPIIKQRMFDFPVGRPAVPAPEEIRLAGELMRLKKEKEELRMKMEELKREKERELMRKEFDLQLERLRREIELKLRKEAKERSEGESGEERESEKGSGTKEETKPLSSVLDMQSRMINMMVMQMVRDFDMLLNLCRIMVERRREEESIKALQQFLIGLILLCIYWKRR